MLATTSAALCLSLLAEIPLPDHTVYGTITAEGGLPITAGALEAEIRRGQALVIRVEGDFVEDEGVVYFVLHIPLETAIGAPGPTGVAAREGDRLGALLLDGETLGLAAAPPPLSTAGLSRIDATSTRVGGGLVFIRGDCSPDRVVNLTDPIALLGFLFLGSVEPPCLEACDGDADGGLTITDAITLLGFLFLGGPAPPPPGPLCDVDDSPSNLGCVTSACP